MADSKISALPAMTTLAGTELVTGLQSAVNSNLTPAQIAAYINTLVVGSGSALRMLFSITAANMNSTADQQFTKLGTFTAWTPISIVGMNPSTSLTTAAGGVYSAASKGGDAIVAASQTYAAGMTSAVGRTPLAVTNSVAGRRTETPYLSLTIPQGAAATADFYIWGPAF